MSPPATQASWTLRPDADRFWALLKWLFGSRPEAQTRDEVTGTAGNAET